MSELPEGWVEAKLSDVCHLITDGTHHSPPNGAVGDFMYVTAKNIQPHGLDLTDVTYVSGEIHHGIYARCPAEPGDVLLVKDGATTGRAAINTAERPISLLSSVALLKPRREIISNKFLLYWLHHPSVLRGMTDDMTGSAIKRLILRQIRDLRIILPPLPEQRRIADKVEALWETSRKLQERIEHSAGLLGSARDAAVRVLLHVQSAPIVPLSELGRWVSGGTPSRSRSDYWVGGEIPWVSPKDMKVDFLNDAQEHVTTASVEATAARILPPNCVLMVVRGMILAHSFPVAVNRVPVAVNQDIRALLPADGVEPEFVLRVLQARRIQVLEKVKEATHGTKRLDMEDLLDIQVPLPEPTMQRLIARNIGELISLIRSVDGRIELARRRAKDIRQAILTKAFAGELVPTEAEVARKERRFCEPAAVLLERIEQRGTPRRRSKAVGESDNITPRNTSSGRARRALDAVLRENGPLSPERLFTLAGFDEESVDLFYDELRTLITNNKVRESRPNETHVLLAISRS